MYFEKHHNPNRCASLTCTRDLLMVHLKRFHRVDGWEMMVLDDKPVFRNKCVEREMFGNLFRN